MSEYVYCNACGWKGYVSMQAISQETCGKCNLQGTLQKIPVIKHDIRK